MTMEATGGETAPAGPPQSASLEAPSLVDDIGRSTFGDKEESGKPKPAPKPKDAKDANGQTAADKAAVARYKARINGEEIEHDGPTLAQMLSDDYEREVLMPGGKPAKLTNAEIIRLAQQGTGAQTKLREAAEMVKRQQAIIDAGKEDVPAYLREHLGIEDPEDWIRQAAAILHKRDNRILQMIQSQDPQVQYEGVRLQQQLSDRRAAESRKLQQSVEAREATARQESEAKERSRGEIARVFKEQRVPWSDETEAMGRKLYSEHKQATGLALSTEEVAKAVRREIWKARRAELESLQDDEIPQFMGDKLRERIRTLELALAKAGKAAAKEAAPPKPQADAEWTKPRPGEDERDYNRRMRVGPGGGK